MPRRVTSAKWGIRVNLVQLLVLSPYGHPDPDSDSPTRSRDDPTAIMASGAEGQVTVTANPSFRNSVRPGPGPARFSESLATPQDPGGPRIWKPHHLTRDKT